MNRARPAMWQAINIISASLIGIGVGALFRRRPVVLLMAGVIFATLEGALVFAAYLMTQHSDAEVWVQLGNPLIAPAALVAACTGMGLAAVLLRDPEPKQFRSLVPVDDNHKRGDHWRSRAWTAVGPDLVEDEARPRANASGFAKTDRQLEEVRIEPQAPAPIPLRPRRPDGPDRGRRGQTRRRTVLSGLIVSGQTTIPCTLRDLSVGGARLQLQSDQPLPKTITLVDRTNGIAHAAAIAWRSGRDLGVRFQRSIDLKTATDGEAANLRKFLR